MLSMPGTSSGEYLQRVAHMLALQYSPRRANADGPRLTGWEPATEPQALCSTNSRMAARTRPMASTPGPDKWTIAGEHMKHPTLSQLSQDTSHTASQLCLVLEELDALFRRPKENPLSFRLTVSH